MSDRGEVLTDPGEMAGALREHWQGVFARRATDEQCLDQWIREDSPHPLPAATEECWRLRRRHVEVALEL